MSETTNRDEPRRERLDEVIGAFLVALDVGENPKPADWLARHPDLCPELAEFFTDRERMDELVEPLRLAPEPTTDFAFSVLKDTADDGPSASLPKGTEVRYFGDYELQKVLGEGGMGIVYKARQISLNRSVALKMIKAARFASDDDRRRFRNEAEAVARLDHPHIVPIFEVGHFEDQHYFSMKLIGGESLDKQLKGYITDPRRAAKLVAVVAGAVHHAHQRGILHRDLKPANILLDADGQPHVTDFGLAKRIEGDSELTQSGAILGTPAYMAPEQASGSRGTVTTSTDVYGLGAVLFALLTGRAPFSGKTVLDTLEHVRERLPESPLKREQASLKDALAQSHRRAAMLNLERGQAACDQGQIGVGLLWMIESLRAATDAGDQVWKNVALTSLSGWQRLHPRLMGVFEDSGAVTAVALSPDGKAVITGTANAYTARLWDTVTGRAIGRPMERPEGVAAVAFTPDSNAALTVGMDGTSRLWNAGIGLPINKPVGLPPLLVSVEVPNCLDPRMSRAGDRIYHKKDEIHASGQ